ncbi:MAG TPA: prolyl oligopeptidase family serine peptidase [Candidatus Polarisedimenticolia bacterium]|nr:prolyl oligopeptidase family serine peptidase [Candidatus Polarisedimenticolia bacterium]
MADRIAAPLIVVQGANDPRVPRSEAEQIVASLRRRGRPVEYLLFEDEGHGVVKLPNRIKAYGAIAEFLDRHLHP